MAVETVCGHSSGAIPDSPRWLRLTSGDDPASVAASKLADYRELTKPKIAVMALITVTVGFTLGSAGQWQWMQLSQ